MQNRKEGTLQNEDGLWVWDTVYPLLDMITAESLAPEPAARDYFWKVVVHVGNDIILDAQIEIWTKVLTITGLLLTLIGLSGWTLAWAEGAIRKVNTGLEEIFFFDLAVGPLASEY